MACGSWLNWIKESWSLETVLFICLRLPHNVSSLEALFIPPERNPPLHPHNTASVSDICPPSPLISTPLAEIVFNLLTAREAIKVTRTHKQTTSPIQKLYCRLSADTRLLDQKSIPWNCPSSPQRVLGCQVGVRLTEGSVNSRFLIPVVTERPLTSLLPAVFLCHVFDSASFIFAVRHHVYVCTGLGILCSWGPDFWKRLHKYTCL